MVCSFCVDLIVTETELLDCYQNMSYSVSCNIISFLLFLKPEPVS